MRVPRLYLDADLATDAVVDLDDRAHRHAVQVLRLRAGDAVVLFNGRGGEFIARLTDVERRGARASIESFDPREPESPLHVTLAQGVAKGDHMDYSLQKAVELGVSRIEPVVTERTVGRWEARRAGNKLEHWRGIVVSACEQSGRTRLPELAEPVQLRDWLVRSRDGVLPLVLDPGADRPLRGLDAPIHRRITVLIGPEGGLSDHEIEAASATGFIRVRLGKRVLRTETAATAALAAVQLLWGDLGI